MDGFKLNDVSDVFVESTLAKQVYAGDTKIWDYKTPPVYTAPTAKTGLVYSGSAQALLNAGSTSHGTIQYSADGLSWSTSIPTSTNASASITVYWRLVGDGRHTDVASTAVVCSIAKAAPTYTAPTAKSGLVYNNTNQALLNAGSTSHGTIQYSSDGSTWGADIPTGKNATGYTVYWRLVGDSNHNSISSTSIACSISKVTPTVTAPTAKTLTYSGSAQALVNAGSTNWGTLQYSLDNSSWSTSVPTGTNATSYTVYYKVVGDSNINDVAAKSVSCSIGKVTPTVTAPTAKVLTYNTSAQELVNAGSTNFGTLQYSLNNSTWGTTIPSATNQGSYTVYYRVVGNSNINDVASASVACSINEKKVTATVTLSQSTYTYSGSACEPTVTVKDGTTVIPASEYTVSYSNNINAGTATVTISDNTGGNYEVIGSATFTINKAAGVAGVSGRGLTYSRGAQNLATVSGNTGTVHYRLGTSGSFSTTIPAATNAGSYTVQYYVDASANYNGVASSSSPNSVNTVIAQVTPVLSTSPSLVTGLTYNGSARNLLSGGAMKHSSSDTTAVSGTFSYTQQTNAGTYNNPTWSFTPSDTTNYKSTSGTITGSVTIAKATGSVNISAISVSYNGSERNLVSVSGNTGTMHYRVGTSGSFSGTIPTATNAASYDIYWYMDASANYNGLHSSSSPAKVTSSIAKIDPTITAPTAKTGLVYNGSEQTLWNAGTNTTAGSFSYSKGTNAGSYTATWSFTPTDTTNYNTKSGSATISIAKAAGSISYATTSVSKTYGNGAFTNALTKSGDGSVTYASSATGVATVNGSGQVTIVGAGSATITATVTDGTNYTYATKTASYTLSVAKATPTVTAPTAKSLTYSGSAQTLINAGSTTGGTLQYKVGSGSYGTGLPSATAKGTYTVYYKVVGNSNYNDVAEASISVSIAAKALTITAKDQSVSYGTAISTGTSQVTASGLVSGDSLTAITLTQSTTNVTTSGTITPSAAATTNGAGNYSITYNTGKLTINKVSASVATAPSAKSLTYSGSAQALVNAGTPSGGTMYYQMTTSNSKPSSTSGFSTTIPTGTNAGTYYVWYYVKGDSNHNDSAISSSAVSVTIANKSISIPTPTGVSRDYNGNASIATFGATTGASITKYRYGTNGTSWTETTTNPSQTNVGTLYVQAYYTAGTNYTGSNWSASATITISQVTPTVTAPTAKVLTYNTSAQELVNAGSTNFGTLKYSLDNSTWSTSIPKATNQGSYTVYYKVDGDSNIKSVAAKSVACSINEKKVTATVTLSQTSYTYSGSACKPTVTVKDGTTVIPASEYTVTYSNNTNVGTATVTITDNTGGNYDVVGSATFTISKANISPSVSLSGWTYGGTANNPSVSGNPGSGSVTYHYKVQGAADSTYTTTKPSSAGSYTVRATVAATSNYNGNTCTANFTIAQKEVTLTWGTVTWTYDKSAHSTTCTAGSLVSGDTCTVTLAGNSITNAGTTTVTASSLSNSNYKLPSANTKTLTVNARTVTLSWGTTSWTYDKTAHSTTCTAGNLCSGDSCTVTLTGNSITNKGTATVTASSLSNSNYALPSSKTNTLTVNAREVTLSWGTTSWTYDKTAHSTTCTAGNVCSGDTCTVTLTGNSITNKGTATVTASSLSNSNYALPSSKTATLTINAKEVGLSWGTTSWTYDKASHSTTCTATGLISGDSCTVTLTGNSVGANVGSATVTASSLSNSNYKLPSANTKTISITAKTVSLSWGTLSWTYDASAHSTTCTAGSLVSGDSCTVTLTGNSITNKGTTTVTASSLSNSNYALPSSKTNTLTINARPINVTASSASKTYNGSALTSNSATAEATGTNRGLVSGHSMTSCTVTGTITNAGTANNVPSAAVIMSGSTDVTSNYSITYVNGTLTVYKATGNSGFSPIVKNYSHSIQSLGSVSGNTGTNHYRLGESGSWSTSIPTAKDSGVYDIYVYTDASENYNAVGSSSNPTKYSGAIRMVTPELSSAPTRRTGLSYTGSAQNLLTGGAMKHSSSDTTAVEGTFTYLQKTDAGTYSSLRWSFTPTDSKNYYTTSGSVSGEVTIAKINRSSFAVSMSGWTYGGTATNPSVSGNTESGSVTYEYKISGGSYSSTKPTSTSTAGTYYVKATAAATTNYNASTAESTFVIARASRTISFTSAPSTVIKGNTISVAASPSAGSGDGSISFSSGDTTKATVSGSTITGVAKGTVIITASISQGTNYNSASASYTLTVAEWEDALTWSNTLTWPA